MDSAELWALYPTYRSPTGALMEYMPGRLPKAKQRQEWKVLEEAGERK